MQRLPRRAALVAAALVLTNASFVIAQTADTATRKTVPLAAVTITATRTERSTFDTPQPISVLDSAQIREKLAHSPINLFHDVPGLDASGVGPNQRRPEIRGQRGQRILLLKDGLRLNNTRRQQDFGELPALGGISSIQQVEVVRGPSSVLYGTDAIGGVVNLISGAPPKFGNGEIHGELSYRYGSAGDASTPNGALAGRFGRFGFRANAAFRDVQPYSAPSGSFGNITLAEKTLVHDSGVRDRSYDALLSFDVSPTSEVFTRADFYSAENAGFGFVDPEALGAGQARVQILYPDQDYSRYTAGYRARAASLPFANRVEVSTYVQRNERFLNTFVLAPIGPNATVDSKSYNFTDLATVGGRAELAKAIGTRSVLTYGVDAFRDRSNNTDSSRTIVTGFGPPSSTARNTPQIPNAVFRSAGVFAQLEVTPIERLTAVVGARGQDVTAETRETTGITTPLVKGSDRTGVWTANALYRIADGFNAVGSVGRGFRAANLVERFFEGTVAESNGFQQANPSLSAETSVNVDIGLRYRRGLFYGETFVFRNDVHNAIKAVATGETVNGRAAFQNRNVGELRIEGLELTSGLRSEMGIDASVSFTRLDGRNISDPGSPIGDSYSSKIVGDVAYTRPGGLFTVGYTLRNQGEQKDVIIGANPIGEVIPAFAVHSARASVRVFQRAGITNRVALSVDNIGNRLYAEFPNASFFRPEAGRNISLALMTSF